MSTNTLYFVNNKKFGMKGFPYLMSDKVTQSLIYNFIHVPLGDSEFNLQLDTCTSGQQPNNLRAL